MFEDRLVKYGMYTGAGILLITALIYLFFPFTVRAYVYEKSWERTVDIERYQLNVHEGWSVPYNARIIDTYEKERDTEEYECGVDEYGDTIYCEEVIYDTWYVYEIWEWTYIRTLMSKGEDNPFWPYVAIRDSDPINPERFGRHTETYTTIFRAKNRDYTYTSNESMWNTLAIETSWLLTVNNAGIITKVEK